MPLSITEKKRFRQIGHQLNPVVMLGGQGLTEGVMAEIDRALEDHELIKVRIGGEVTRTRIAPPPRTAARQLPRRRPRKRSHTANR